MRLDERTRRWVMEELRPIKPTRAFALAPWLRTAGVPADPRTGRLATRTHYYECSLYDSAERRCTAWETRPDTCRLYPDGTPGWPASFAGGASIDLPPACSFRPDVGLPIILTDAPARP